MSLTLANPTYATQGPSKSGQILANNEQTALETAFIGRSVVTLDGSATTGTINFIDGTQTIFSTGTSQAYPNQGLSPVVAPAAVTCQIVGAVGANAAANNALTVNAGTPTTTGFPIYLSAHGSTATAETGSITSWSISSNVVTFNTSAMSAALSTGQQFTVSGLTSGSFLNGVVFTALSGGSTTVNTANFTHANASATEAGTLTAYGDTITVQFTAYKN